MASLKHQISNILAAFLILFALFCFQGHLTTQLTPTFAAQIHASIRPLNQQIYAPLGLSDAQLNIAFAAINVINIVSLLSTETRKVGFLVNFIFYAVGMASTTKIGESPFVHIGLIWVSLIGFLFREE